MRRTMMIAAGLLAGLVSTVALAETKFAVADTQLALYSTDAAKKMEEKLQADLKVQYDRIGQIKTEVEALQAKFQKDSAIMTEKDKQALQKQGEGKIQEYNNLTQMVQKRTQEARGEFLQRTLPKLEAVIEDLQKANKYDVIFDKRSAVYTDPSVDITKKITEKLNAVLAAGK